MKLDLNIYDTFNKEIPADPNLNNTRRQVRGAGFSYVTPRMPSDPRLVHVSDEMLNDIGLNIEDKQSEAFLKVFSGSEVMGDTKPYAMCYGGHQFGHWAGQLGDGRAINLCEVLHNEHRWALQLKGAGETPYSRSADGLAVLRSSVREHLCSEAMHHLGVPTTRSLSLILTGDEVLRDMLYDGNAAYEKGAVVCRVAPSFIRFGNFQIFAASQDLDNLKKLADYTIKYFFPKVKLGTKDTYIQFFQSVADRTRDMIIHWKRVGFVHGVMNTDNMSVLGLTIDYGPYGWLEGYDHAWTPNTTDAQGKRYRFGQQSGIALWNLLQLANALFPLVQDPEPFQKVLQNYKETYSEGYLNMMRQKLGFHRELEIDATLIEDLEKTLQLTETDMTIFFRNLSNVSKDSIADGRGEILDLTLEAFYKKEDLKADVLASWVKWFDEYIDRLNKESVSDDDRRTSMNQINPKYVLRNYMAQMAIDKADSGDFSLIQELYMMLKKPYDEQSKYQKWFAKRPEWARHKVGCSMLSCSS